MNLTQFSDGTLTAPENGCAQTSEFYSRNRAANLYSACAVQSLLYEVSVTPKPGLVDRANSGSHKDMDFFTFLDSSAALSPWFREMFCLGWDYSQAPTAELFQRLRIVGCQAEREMLVATRGVNTHKGLIFSLGLLCGALGALRSRHTEEISLSQILALCAELGQCALDDFEAKDTLTTHGLKCFQDYRVLGARGEAAQGFPSAAEIGLPSLRRWTSESLSLNDAAAITLLALIAHTEDTNMIHRGGLESARWRQTQAQELLARMDRYNFRFQLEELDRQYIRENLSPGGCADLLAISLMLFFLEERGLASS